MNLSNIQYRVAKSVSLAINFPEMKNDTILTLKRINYYEVPEKEIGKAQYLIETSIKYIEKLYPKRTK